MLIEKIKNEFMVIKALGVVYGDIGTSPIYTLAVIFAFVTPTIDNLFGILSFVFWTLTILVTVQYAWLATSLSKRGEGGTVVLVQLLLPYIKNAKVVAIITLLSYLGISLMIGDGVITPAISILSAVEGIAIIPGYEDTPKLALLLIASCITIALFFVQKNGVEKVASAFGPIMVVWFLALAFSGLYFIVANLNILKAISPTYAIDFIINHPFISFVMLADVILAATGGEALYADMGHLGRLPILKGWLFAFVALVLSYYGQGAFILSHPNALQSPLFEMVKAFAPALYIPFLILTVIATIIASQAMISGIFSVLYQAMTTRIFPHFKVEYTSNELRAQIYVGSINWFLMFCVIAMLFIFQESAKLAAAYGFAVAGAMSITGLLMSLIFWYKRKYTEFAFSVLAGLTSCIFFASCTLKIPHGAFWSIIIAALPFFMILLYTKGQKKLYSALAPINKGQFLEEYTKLYETEQHINGAALFFARQEHSIPSYIYKTMFQNNIIYKRNIIVVVRLTNESHGITSELTPIAEGLESLIVYVGYMEMVDISKVLEQKGIHEKTIFYGQEEIVSKNPIWNLYAAIKGLSPSFVSFYKFPHQKLIGVTRRVEI